MQGSQLGLFRDLPSSQGFSPPSTRYQGSKQKLSDWIWRNIHELPFDTALDALGGTGSVAYLLKWMEKETTYNDILAFNYLIGKSIIENDNEVLSQDDCKLLLVRSTKVNYPTLIEDTFGDIYYYDHENHWLDMVITNIERLPSTYKRALAFNALAQACLVKRPYNLFHRKNLYIRSANVERKFGNKVTWDKPFEEHFLKFVEELNRTVFSNGRKNRALNADPSKIVERFDLVYIDPPYLRNKGTGLDYLDFYHFLEGLADYENWHKKIDYGSKHRKMMRRKTPWTNRKEVYDALDKLFAKFQDS